MSGKTWGGNAWLKAALCEVVWANPRSHTSYLGAQLRRLSRRRGIYTALLAVAHSLRILVYHVLKTQQPSHEPGLDYFEKLQQAQLERHHMRSLEQLGYTVTLASAAGVCVQGTGEGIFTGTWLSGFAVPPCSLPDTSADANSCYWWRPRIVARFTPGWRSR